MQETSMTHIEIAQLRAENDRLRNALKKIADGNGIYGIQAGEYKGIARAALQHKAGE